MKTICRLLTALAMAVAMASASAAQQFRVTWAGATVLTNVVITATINAADTATFTGTVYDTTGIVSGSINGQTITDASGRFVLDSSNGNPFSTDGVTTLGGGETLGLAFNAGDPFFYFFINATRTSGSTLPSGTLDEVVVVTAPFVVGAAEGPLPANTINIAAVPIEFGGFLSSFLSMVLGALLILRRMRNATTPIDR